MDETAITGNIAHITHISVIYRSMNGTMLTLMCAEYKLPLTKVWYIQLKPQKILLTSTHSYILWQRFQYAFEVPNYSPI